jgi:hypothetical protein
MTLMSGIQLIMVSVVTKCAFMVSDTSEKLMMTVTLSSVLLDNGLSDSTTITQVQELGQTIWS